jgi:hypothetical protein
MSNKRFADKFRVKALKQITEIRYYVLEVSERLRSTTPHIRILASKKIR